MSRVGNTVAERLTLDIASTLFGVINIQHPRKVEEWDVTSNLY